MGSVGIAIIGGGIFVKEQHIVSISGNISYPCQALTEGTGCLENMTGDD